MNIFVAKMNFDTKEDSVRTLFEEFGEVDTVKVIMDRMTGRSKGYGFVEMPNDEEGNAAIEALNDTDFDGRTIVVKKSEPKKTDRGGGGYNRGGGDRGGNRDNYNRRY